MMSCSHLHAITNFTVSLCVIAFYFFTWSYFEDKWGTFKHENRAELNLNFLVSDRQNNVH